MRSKILISLLAVFLCLGLTASFLIVRKEARAEPDIFASPINAGCYIAGPNDCRFHVEPFTINLATSSKIVQFRIVAFPTSGSSQIIYDFRPDSSNPPPPSGSTYTPSLVAQDFAATCGKSYTLSLQGIDSSNPTLFNLGTTAQFTCPSAVP